MNKSFKNYVLVKCSIFLCCVALFSCAESRFGAREKGALTGGAVGAGLGAIVGNQVRSPGAGIAIGAGLGALSGAAIGQGIDSSDEAQQRNSDRLTEQERMIDENRRILRELQASGQDARETERGIVVNLPDVLFEFDSSRLTPDAQRTTREISDVLRKHHERFVSVEGHTDSVGSESYNLRLSRERAYSVADNLSSEGVSKKRIAVRGYGEERPVASNDSASGRSKNRRVEVIIEK